MTSKDKSSEFETETKKRKDKRILTLFLVVFPSLIIAGDWGLPLAANIGLKAALIFYQVVVLKVFLDSYYGYN